MQAAQKPFSFGQTCTRLDIAGLIITETRHNPNQKLPRHRHDLTNILFPINGKFNENSHGRTETCEPLSLFIRPAEEPHSNEYDSTGTRCLIVGVESGWRALDSSFPDVLTRPSLTRSAAIAGLGTKLRREMILADGASALSIEGIILELMAEAMRASVGRKSFGRPRWFDRVLEMLHANFAESMQITEIADEVGVHSVHLARSFRKFHGCSIGEYIRRLRIEFAQKQLALTDRQLVDISLDAGFCAQSHFSTTFKKFVGMTPAEYRTNVRQHRKPLLSHELRVIKPAATMKSS